MLNDPVKDTCAPGTQLPGQFLRQLSVRRIDDKQCAPYSQPLQFFIESMPTSSAKQHAHWRNAEREIKHAHFPARY